MSELLKLSDTYRDTLKSMKSNLASQMKGAFKSFFDENPEVRAIVWVQYTPHFNDGDECVFGVHEMHPVNEDQLKKLQNDDIRYWDLDDISYEYEYGDKKDQPKPAYLQAADEFTEVLRSVDDDIFKAAFGDHCQIIATRDGFEVDEFSHD